MNILIIGKGGREHALAWKLRQSPKINDIFVAPGNAGTSQIANNIPLSKTDDIVNWVKENNPSLVIVGPDNYLADGIVDRIKDLNVHVFGPTKNASEIEWSKSFAKYFMKKENIPTARYKIFDDFYKAKKYIQNESFPLVIKADGLALGKGVVIAQTLKEASVTLNEMMRSKVFGSAGEKVVIEECLKGVEISIHVFSDGKNISMFPSSQDRKRIFENDEGPNTGGMGTITPVPTVTNKQMDKIKEKVVLPTIMGLEKMGRPFKGILFPGIMLTKDGPKVIEFNARFGDPETQSYMRILETDLLPILLSCINGDLDKQKVHWSDTSACCIVLASEGYPGEYNKGEKITGLKNINDDTEIFHAGTTVNNNSDIITNGGRVLGVTSIGDSLPETLEKAYSDIEHIDFKGMQFRGDIGK